MSCARCGIGVYSAEDKIQLNKVWHKCCFSCYICGRPLDKCTAKVYQGEIFCCGCVPEPKHNSREFRANCVGDFNHGIYPPVWIASYFDCSQNSECESSCSVAEAIEDMVANCKPVHSCSCLPACCSNTDLYCFNYPIPREVANYYNRGHTKPCYLNCPYVPRKTFCFPPLPDPPTCGTNCGSPCPPKVCCPPSKCCPPKSPCDSPNCDRCCRPRSCSPPRVCYLPRDCGPCCPPPQCCPPDTVYVVPKKCCACTNTKRCRPKTCRPKSCCPSPRPCPPSRGNCCGAPGECDDCCGGGGGGGCRPRPCTSPCYRRTRCCSPPRRMRGCNPCGQCYEDPALPCCPDVQDPCCLVPKFYGCCRPSSKYCPCGGLNPCNCKYNRLKEFCTAYCVRCGNKVYVAEKVLVSSGAYHTSCFSCCCCRKLLTLQNFYENCGEIYCKKCYNESYSLNYYGLGLDAAN